MIELDGSYGEGGGQIVRTALALSMLTQQPFHIKDIRKGRNDSGLKSQHLHSIKALQKLSDCRSEGAELGSTQLTFHPTPIKPSNITINIGTAGSITLVLQAILLPIIFAKKPITLTIKGGTDVKWATTIDHFRSVLLPQLQKFAKIEVKTHKRGYYPKGNGEVEVSITPKLSFDHEHTDTSIKKLKAHIKPYESTTQERITKINGIAHSSLDLEKNHVAERIAQGASQLLSRHFETVSIKKEYSETESTGCGITIWTHSDNQNASIGADMLGEKQIRAEEVGKIAAEALIKEIDAKAAVDSHTMDSLMPFLALAGGTIRSSAITPHTETNIYAVEAFLGKRFSLNKASNTITCA
jgi:RNA 3'-phosphate cyclase